MRYEVPVFVDRVRPIFTHPVMVLRVWNTVCPVTDSVGVARLGIGGLDRLPQPLHSEFDILRLQMAPAFDFDQEVSSRQSLAGMCLLATVLRPATLG
jgi:hypothetical protein